MRAYPFLLCGLLFVGIQYPVASAAEGQIVISGELRPSTVAPEKNFTGKVRVDPAFATKPPARAYGSYVTFEPGARTHWHSHPLGQTLIVTFGTGLTQEWGGPVKVIRQGDVVVCSPNVKHWHGAAPNSAMTHLAIGERDENKSVTWMEKVTDKQYNAR